MRMGCALPMKRLDGKLRLQCRSCGYESEWHEKSGELVRGVNACYDATGKRKVLFRSRATAKSALKKRYGSKHALSVYPCSGKCNNSKGFHVGH